MKRKCSQYFVRMIESSRVPPLVVGDTPENVEKRRASFQRELELRIGELERRESTWGAAHAGVRQLAYDIQKLEQGFSVHSDAWTVIGMMRTLLRELADARAELKRIEDGAKGTNHE